eukprot:TCONS_00068167-protein
MSRTSINDDDENLFKWLEGGKLLISIIFLGVGIFMVVLWAKRQILRLYLINKKGPIDQAGHAAPKGLRREIENSFNKISGLRLEPKLLSDPGQHEPLLNSFVDERDDSSYKFRRKAFDLMSCLDELLSRVDFGLARKPSQNVREHLVSLQSPPYAPFEGKEYENLCEQVTRLYEHARYGAKEFGEQDYHVYSEKIDQLYDRVHQKLLVPGSLVVHADHQHQVKTQSQCTSNVETELTSQVILPSTLVESKTSGLRNRDGSKNIV